MRVRKITKERNKKRKRALPKGSIFRLQLSAMRPTSRSTSRWRESNWRMSWTESSTLISSRANLCVHRDYLSQYVLSLPVTRARTHNNTKKVPLIHETRRAELQDALASYS